MYAIGMALKMAMAAYDQMEDKVFSHTCCQAMKQRIAIHSFKKIFMVHSYVLFQVTCI